jgi:hypothetical protein
MRKDRTALTYYSTRSCCLTPFRSRHLSVSSLELISRPNLATTTRDPPGAAAAGFFPGVGGRQNG